MEQNGTMTPPVKKANTKGIPRMNAAKRYILSLLIGLSVGCLTLDGQRILPMQLNFLANSGAVWMIPSFCVSRLSKDTLRRCIVGSALCLLGCVAGYYLLEALLHRHAFAFNSHLLLWTVLAVIGGGVSGTAAYLANHAKGIWQQMGIDLVPALFLAEGINKLLHIREYAHMAGGVWLTAALGAALYLLFHGRSSFKAKNLPALGLTVFAAAILYEALYRFTI